MSLKTLQNFYKQTVSQTWETGTGTRYVSVKPTPSEGWLVVSPSNTSLREIVYYTSTGTDGTGDYVVLSQRGLGGTSDQTHSINEPIRMNFTAQHQQEISDAMDQIVAGGAQDSSTSTKGIVKLSVAPVSATAPIAVGDNDPRVLTSGTPAKTADVQNFIASGTWTKPTGAATVEIICIGGGGGGGGGGTAGGAQGAGGGGGGGGGRISKTFRAAELGATETVTVGNGGTGSAGGAAGGNDGTAGNPGEATTVGAFLKAWGGSGGGAGKYNTTSIGGNGGAGIGIGSTSVSGTTGVAASGGGASGAGATKQVNGSVGGAGYLGGAAGGGSGGGSSDPSLSGGTGGAQNGRGTAISGGTGGAAAGANENGGTGGNATDCVQYESIGGAGGGGGAGVFGTANGGTGGNGGKYGGGGGGGGAGAGSAKTGGTGGNGAIGFCQVITYF
jgi:hypothetical protein